MTNKLKKISLLIAYVASTLIFSYSLLIVFNLVGWFLNDDIAFRMNNKDWAITAILRIAEAVIFGLIISVIIYVLLKFTHSWNGTASKLPIRCAAFSFASITAMALYQGIVFYIDKPFI